LVWANWSSQPAYSSKEKTATSSLQDRLRVVTLINTKDFSKEIFHSLILSEVCVYKTIIIINFKKPGRRHYYNAKIL
jgi:hypothetical protein